MTIRTLAINPLLISSMLMDSEALSYPARNLTTDFNFRRCKLHLRSRAARGKRYPTKFIQILATSAFPNSAQTTFFFLSFTARAPSQFLFHFLPPPNWANWLSDSLRNVKTGRPAFSRALFTYFSTVRPPTKQVPRTKPHFEPSKSMSNVIFNLAWESANKGFAC